MRPRATVLIPTHNHGPTLRYSVPSALDQTVEDIEIFIVGDGVPDVTRSIVDELMRADERVRFSTIPKDLASVRCIGTRLSKKPVARSRTASREMIRSCVGPLIA